ncbi:MAG: 6-bladed beta-propeller [Acidobacteria bacterium]|nr:6-bladed beta-propeller [Acidobacteriota bacterium]
MSTRLAIAIATCAVSLCLAPALAARQNLATMTPEARARAEAQNAALQQMVRDATRLPLVPRPIAVTPPAAGWATGMVSWVASDRDGRIYLLQRGDKADPVIVLDESGKVLRSWGKGLYTTPHAIRVDPQGNVWTTDAASSMVYKFSPTGDVLLEIEVGGQPTPCNNFCSTSDVAFAPDGHVLIADGYRNARILEYTADGRKVREFGTAGTGPGQFVLPHSIQIDAAGVIYVADRENGRIQRFDRSGKFLGEWTQYGKTFGLTLDGDALWLSTIPRGPNSAPGWLLKIDRASGRLLGYVDAQGNHGMSVLPNGDLLHAPGPDLIAQRYSGR